MKRGFTLIELLVVVAVIAILAAIAVPNLLTAQTRSKVARAKADLRALTTALEAYGTDNGGYPPCNAFATAGNRTPVVTEDYLYLEVLSTPVAYITNALPPDVFRPAERIAIAQHSELPGMAGPTEATDLPAFLAYSYQSWNDVGRTTREGGGFDQIGIGRAWLLQSAGPDRKRFNMGGILANFTQSETLDIVYDPTNGTISFGSIFRVGGESPGDYGAAFAQAIDSLD